MKSLTPKEEERVERLYARIGQEAITELWKKGKQNEREIYALVDGNPDYFDEIMPSVATAVTNLANFLTSAVSNPTVEQAFMLYLEYFTTVLSGVLQMTYWLGYKRGNALSGLGNWQVATEEEKMGEGESIA